MASTNRRWFALVVFVASWFGFFFYHGFNNDHFDRITRARQIVVFGDLPFRDFFDPGYFLTLYASAFAQRVFGDNLLGELVLNISFMAAGATVVFLLGSNAGRSIRWGLVAALLVVAAEPRTYDYDKVLFYPLGLYVCWRYIERPTMGSLIPLGAVMAAGGLFRFDTTIYIGAAAVVGIVALHWGDWKIATGRIGVAGLAALLFAAPALVFVQATSGLGDAYEQISAYAHDEGQRTRLFERPAFDINWSQIDVGLPNEQNAAAWLYYVAVSLPILTILLLLWRRSSREPARIAKLLSYATMGELVAIFILRSPIASRIGAVIPLVVIGEGLLVGEWSQQSSPGSGFGRRVFSRLPLLQTCAVVTFSLTAINIWALLWIPPKTSAQFVRRLVEYAHQPPALELLPKGELQPIVEYVRDCTRPSDRVLATWFVPELYFFSRRGFAAGLPVVLGPHWSELRYQRRSIAMLETQSVPIILSFENRPMAGYQFVSDFIDKRYERAYEGKLSVSPPVQIWVRSDLKVERRYGPLMLPCYTSDDQRVTDRGR